MFSSRPTSSTSFSTTTLKPICKNIFCHPNSTRTNVEEPLEDYNQDDIYVGDDYSNNDIVEDTEDANQTIEDSDIHYYENKNFEQIRTVANSCK